MSRPPTRPITWQFVLRTFKPVDMIARAIDAEAKAMVERGVGIPAPQYMDDIWQYMRKLGFDDNTHPNGNCPQCGNAIMVDHNGARYCSTACRQRAYRVRKAVAEGRNSPVAKRRRTKPTRKELAMKEVEGRQDAQKEVLAFANSMYALHLNALGGEEKRSAKPQSDASSAADDKQNVTQHTDAHDRPSGG